MATDLRIFRNRLPKSDHKLCKPAQMNYSYNKALRTATAGIFAAGAIISATAATVVEGPASVLSSTIPGNNGTFGLVTTFSVPQFDTLGGARTLISVAYDLVVLEDGAANMNSPTAAGDYSVQFLGQYRLVRPDAAFLNTGFVNGTSGDVFLGLGEEWDGFLTDTDGASGSSSLGTLLDMLDNGPATFQPWEVRGGSTTLTGTPSGQSISATFAGLVDSELTVTYTYVENSTEVPEAGTWMAMAPLAALGVWSIRRRAKAAKV